MKLSISDSDAKRKFIIPKLITSGGGSTGRSLSNKFVIPKLIQNLNVSNEKSDCSNVPEVIADRLSPLKLTRTPINSLTNSNYNKQENVESCSTIAQNVVSHLTSESNINKDSIFSDDTWHIDLTAALQSETSVSSSTEKPKKKVEETFEVPFIDCEVETLESNFEMLECQMDISEILTKKLKNYKGISKFGKILCRRYKRTKVCNITFSDMFVHKDRRFLFKTPSPDDIIIKRLRRK